MAARRPRGCARSAGPACSGSAPASRPGGRSGAARDPCRRARPAPGPVAPSPSGRGAPQPDVGRPLAAPARVALGRELDPLALAQLVELRTLHRARVEEVLLTAAVVD